jgi:hypothetical protein
MFQIIPDKVSINDLPIDARREQDKNQEENKRGSVKNGDRFLNQGGNGFQIFHPTKVLSVHYFSEITKNWFFSDSLQFLLKKLFHIWDHRRYSAPVVSVV